MRLKVCFRCVAIAGLGLTIAVSQRVTCQSTEGTPESLVRFLPGSIVLPPFTAHYQEPRVGLRKQVGSSRMKLDIGATMDLVEVQPAAGGSTVLRLGVDFFTYALTTSSQGLRLQVDAVDGFFGGHLVLRSADGPSVLAARLRILHLSAHFLDGHFDRGTQSWKGGREPVPFTRDFGELVLSYCTTWPDWSLQAYSGVAYATLVRPTDVRRWSSLHGVELSSESIVGTVLGHPCTLFLADNLTISGVPHTVGTNNVEAGCKLGSWKGAGVRLYASFYAGLEIFSQYYNVYVTQWGIGFAFDMW